MSTRYFDGDGSESPAEHASPPPAIHKRNVRLLMLEDQVLDAELCERELKRGGLTLNTHRVDTRVEFEAALDRFTPDLIISDFSLPDSFDGLAALDIARRKAPETPFVFVSGTIGEERAVEAMKRGATDYVLKDRLSRLIPVITRALQEVEERAARRRAEEETARQRTFLRQVIDLAPIFIFAEDPAGRFVLVNQAVADAYGSTVEEMLGKSPADFDQVKRYGQIGIRPVDGSSGEAVEDEVITDAAGKVRRLQTIRRPIVSEDGAAGMTLGVAMDITELKNHERRIARLSRFRAVVSGINSAIVRVNDREQLLQDACRIAVEEGQFLLAWVGAIDRATLDIKPIVWHGKGADHLGSLRLSARERAPGSQGTTSTAARTRKPVVVNDIANDARVAAKDSALARGFRALVVLPLVVGSEMYGVLKLYAAETGVFDQEEIKLLEEVAGNISFALDRLDKAARVDYLAYYDSLTELPNRTLFNDRLTHAVSTAKQQSGSTIAVVMTDIKRFRWINETFGRHAGDALLREIAHRLSYVWPDQGTLARISADCFAAFTEVQDASHVAHLLAQLGKVMEESLSLSGTELTIAMTCGISVFPGDGESADALFSNAEAALNRAKASGERYLFYQQEMSARVSEALLLENKLRRALDREQFVLHYQPKIDIVSGELAGVEALIRWNDPDTGLVPPLKFIPVLEETGMILEAGRWAIQKALEHRRHWQMQGRLAPRVAVNVSPRQLRQKDFVDTVREAIMRSGLHPHGLELEITESVIMEDIEENIAKLRELRSMGVVISIDDFGTGYSSLRYLAKLPVDALKIDRSFTVTMVNESDSMSIVSTIISLAHSLSLKVVAEGVETEEQARFLKLLKCNEAQGYLFSRPVPPEKLQEALEAAAR